MNTVSTVAARTRLLAFLRAATAEAHGGLDASFSALPLDSRAGFARFLVGHAIGWTALGPQLRDFAARELDTPVPDYAALLAQDLAEMDIDTAVLPRIEPPAAACPVAVSYVLAGSRMGIAMIRRQPTWAAETGRAGRYLADPSGPDLFRALRDWMDGPAGDEVDRDAAARAACGAFAVFAHAFDLSAETAGAAE